MNVTLQRRARFSAAHSYSVPDLGPEENARLFGAYAASQGHGHNYRIELAAAGDVDLRTGMAVNISLIDQALRREVVDVLDGRFLNREIDFFRSRIPTTENVVLFAVERLSTALPASVSLAAVTVWESDALWCGWRRGAEPIQEEASRMVVSLTRSYEFAAAHRLHSAHLSDEENVAVFGKCNHQAGHGHNYQLEVTVEGAPDPRTGMVAPLEQIDAAVQDEVLDAMDHRNLNVNVPEFAALNPTSEMLAVVIWRRLERRLPPTPERRLAKVVVRETARNSFEYAGH